MSFQKIVFNKSVRLALSATLIGLGVGGVRAADINLLEQPSSLSHKAAGLVQLSVARAGNRLVSVGERGVVLVSDDNGKSWLQRQVPVSVSLTRVTFVDAKAGWAVGHGGVILATRDAGDSWVKQLDGVAAAKLELAQAQSQGVNASVPRRLADAQRLVEEGADKPFLDIHFFDTQRGLVVGAYGLAFGTTDGGQTWKSVMGSLGVANGRHLYGILAVQDSLYLVGEQGLVLVSRDGGANFSKVEFPGKGTLFGVLSTSSGNVLLAHGLKGNAYRSTDAGKSWDKVNMPPVSLVAGLRLANGHWVLADESGQLHRSDDEGQHFKPVPLSHPTVLAGLVEASNGTLVGSGARGSAPIALAQDNKKAKP